jgi:transcriptional regulator with GAF, ATPase, and Fis domain
MVYPSNINEFLFYSTGTMEISWHTESALLWRLAGQAAGLAEFLEELSKELPTTKRLALFFEGTPGETLALHWIAQGNLQSASKPASSDLLTAFHRSLTRNGPTILEALIAVMPQPWPKSNRHLRLAIRGQPFALLIGAGLGQAELDELGAPLEAVLAREQERRAQNLEYEAIRADRRALMQRVKRPDDLPIVGAQTGLAEVMDAVRQVAATDTPVLILGETGSGKEVVARAIHTQSHRAMAPFLRVNCGAIPPELIDSELFGHERGSFTGAVGVHRGWFERADGGTLFLDEVGELPPAAQVRLLRVLQDGSFQRVGGERTLSVDVRLVAATNRDLRAASRRGDFREDLWFRIAVFPIPLPPLRERLQDIPALAAHFALRAAERLGLSPRMPDAEDLALLTAYPWPGNVRELASVIERSAILGDGRKLEVARALGNAALPSEVRQEQIIQDRKFPSLDAAIRTHIEQALVRCQGRIEGRHGAAALLEINPHTLRSRMRKLGLDWRGYRPAE